MTRIDFYILPESAQDDSILTACKLCDKAAAGGHRVYLHSADTDRRAMINDTPWSFRQGSFIAHEHWDGEALASPLPAVLIGSAQPPGEYQEILLHLDGELPKWFSSFDRVLEIVPGTEPLRRQARERYRFYRERGYQLNTHNL